MTDEKLNKNNLERSNVSLIGQYRYRFLERSRESRGTSVRMTEV
jgi:hypothetical protein